jgi:hypothetical protein
MDVNDAGEPGQMEIRLRTEDFYGLAGTLMKWRLDPVIKLMNKKGGKGKILGFVQGLRLSAQLTYILRKIVSRYTLEVNWGHLVDENGSSCSPECDVIIHKPAVLQEWNGSNDPVMNFKFIKCSDTVAVISCKSFINSIDATYCRDFVKYNVTDIFLFTECCRAGSIQRLTRQAKSAGYKGFFYLYSTRGSQPFVGQDEHVYIEFIRAIENVSKMASPKL